MEVVRAFVGAVDLVERSNWLRQHSDLMGCDLTLRRYLVNATQLLDQALDELRIAHLADW